MMRRARDTKFHVEATTGRGSELRPVARSIDLVEVALVATCVVLAASVVGCTLNLVNLDMRRDSRSNAARTLIDLGATSPASRPADAAGGMGVMSAVDESAVLDAVIDDLTRGDMEGAR